MLVELDALSESLGNPQALLADTGYFSGNNIDACCR